MKRSPEVIFLAIVIAGGSVMLGPVYMWIGLWEQYPEFNPLYIPLVGMIIALAILIFTKNPNVRE